MGVIVGAVAVTAQGRLRGLAWLVGGVLLALQFGCKPAPQSSDRAARAQLLVGLAQAPVSLDPRFATDAASSRINRLLYRRLVDFDERFAPVPELAHWQMVDSRHCRVRLRLPLAHFHDGRPITAQDVAATYRAVLAPGSRSPHKGSIAHIARITVPDQRTVLFELSRDDPLFPGRLTLGILPAGQAAGARRDGPGLTGSGPFEVVAWPRRDRLDLRRRRDGLGVRFLRVGDPTVRVLKLLRGEVNLIQNDLPPELVDYLADKADAGTLLRHPGNTYAYLGFNLQDPVTGRPGFRRAVALAIDRPALLASLWRGRARIAETLLPPEHWASAGELPVTPYDPAAARAALRKAFGNGSVPEVSYKISTDPLRQRIATLLQAQLAKVGIRVRLQSYEWGTFYADIKAGRFQMYSLSWVGVKMPDIFKYLFHSRSVPPEGANRGRYQDPAMDRLLETIERTPDAARRLRALHAVQAKLQQDRPYVSLWFEDQIAFLGTSWRGYQVRGDGAYDALESVEFQGPARARTH